MVRNLLSLAAFVFAVVAAVICYQLTLKHIAGTAGPAWFEAGCSDQASGAGGNCKTVLASRFSYFPPRPADEKPDGKPRVSTALIGLIYYSTLAVWLLAVGRPSPSRRRWHWLPVILVAMGLVASAYFMFIMYLVVNEWCPWCLATHVINVLIAGCLFAMWPGKRDGVAVAPVRQPQAGPEEGDSGGTLAAVRSSYAIPHPSRRLLFVTLIAVVTVGFCTINLVGVKTWSRAAESHKSNFDTCVAVIERVKRTGVFGLLWQHQPEKDIPRRPDDPVRLGAAAGGTNSPLDVVVFSDFECPACGQFADFHEKHVVPMFAGHTRLTFKHYPIDQSCNSLVSRTMHAHACQGATWAEAARVAGGNEAFWKAHDFLFEHRDVLAAGRLDAQSFIQRIGLSEESFRSALSSDTVKKRIEEDVHAARSVGVTGTPGVFVDGRAIDQLVKTDVGFWNALADEYFQRSGRERPSSTIPTSLRTIPDSPGPKAAP